MDYGWINAAKLSQGQDSKICKAGLGQMEDSLIFKFIIIYMTEGLSRDNSILESFLWSILVEILDATCLFWLKAIHKSISNDFHIDLQNMLAALSVGICFRS